MTNEQTNRKTGVMRTTMRIGVSTAGILMPGCNAGAVGCLSRLSSIAIDGNRAPG